ncbi:MAG: hypothetical protein M3Z25_15530 [Actinomycetota bacterium]|nr:hypothetical protein [Actinomycetota bacterium]
MAPRPSDDLEARVRFLEEAVGQLRDEVVLSRTDATAARELAAGADRDVSEVRAELRAHTQVLNALRETQVEQGEEIRQQGEEIRQQGQEMRQGFAQLRTGMQTIVNLLGGTPES